MNEEPSQQVLPMVLTVVILYGLDGTSYRCEPFSQATVVDTIGVGIASHGAFCICLQKILCKIADGTNTSTMNETSQSYNAIDLPIVVRTRT